MANRNSARDFLQSYGHTSLVSLGCGKRLNRIDNHLRLFTALKLTYYVGVDCQSWIEPVSANVFAEPDRMTELITDYYQGSPRKFWEAVRVFPETLVEELAGVHCAVVVSQRVLPHTRWEEVILSMTPRLVLQEDLHGCERQNLRGDQYVRMWSEIRQYGLRPFRPWRVFPGEHNLILWRRRDFGGETAKDNRWTWLRRLREWAVG
jgi:hypothetical protein